MKVYKGLSALPQRRPPAAVTVGNFVGVHLGHRTIIRQLELRAKRLGAVTTVVTFNPHPQKVLRGDAPCALVGEQENLRLLTQAGVDRVVVLRFTRSLSLVEPEEFIERILVKELNAKTVVVGSDFTFGHFARGDLGMLQSFGRKLGFSAEGVRLRRLEGRRLSSTEIRHSLAEGDLDWVTKALGRNYSLRGRIVRGKGRGAKLLGIPTANLAATDGICLPKLGIYAGFVGLGRRRLPGVISVGTNPTFGRNPVSVEAHILDFSGNLVGDEAEFEFVRRLRAERHFPTLQSLSAAISEDVEAARKFLKGIE